MTSSGTMQPGDDAGVDAANPTGAGIWRRKHRLALFGTTGAKCRRRESKQCTRFPKWRESSLLRRRQKKRLYSHKRAGVREALEKVGASLIFLPPYSPDPNPIGRAIGLAAGQCSSKSRHQAVGARLGRLVVDQLLLDNRCVGRNRLFAPKRAVDLI